MRQQMFGAVSVGFMAAILALFWRPGDVTAANGTWTNTADGTREFWTNSANWSASPFPGGGDTGNLTNKTATTYSSVVDTAISGVATVRVYNAGSGTAWLVVTNGATLSASNFTFSAANSRAGIRLDGGNLITRGMTTVAGATNIVTGTGGIWDFNAVGFTLSSATWLTTDNGTGVLATNIPIVTLANTLVITNGAKMYTYGNGGNPNTAFNFTSASRIEVKGAGSELNVKNGFGTYSGNTIWIENGGLFAHTGGGSPNGQLFVDGANTYGMSVIVTNGGQVLQSGTVWMGYQGGARIYSNYTIKVTGSNSLWSGGAFYFANGITGTINNVILITDSGVMTNVSFTVFGASGASSNQLIVSNGGQLWSQAAVPVGGSGSSSNSALVTGANSLWNLGGGNLIVGQPDNTGNVVRVENGGTLRNGQLLLNAMVQNYMKLDSSSIVGLGMTLGSGVAGITNIMDSSVTIATPTNMVLLPSGYTWDGGGSNLVVGSGTAAFDNDLELRGGVFNNFGAVTVGAQSGRNSLVITGQTARLSVTSGGSMTVGQTTAITPGSNNLMQTIDAGVMNAGTLFVGLISGTGAGTRYTNQNSVIVSGGSWTNLGTVVIGSATGSGGGWPTVANGNSLLASNLAALYFGNGFIVGSNNYGGTTTSSSYNLLDAAHAAMSGAGSMVVGSSGLNTAGGAVGNTGLLNVATWDGQGGNIAVGQRLTGSVASNYLMLAAGALSNFGSVTIGTSGYVGNTLEIDGATVLAATNVLVNATNTLALNGGRLRVLGSIVNNASGPWVVGDGTQQAVLELATGTATNKFMGGLTVANNAFLSGTGIVGTNLTLNDGAGIECTVSGGVPGRLQVRGSITAIGTPKLRFVIPLGQTITRGPYTNLTCTVGSVPSNWNIAAPNGYTVVATPQGGNLVLNIGLRQGTSVYFR